MISELALLIALSPVVVAHGATAAAAATPDSIARCTLPLGPQTIDFGDVPIGGARDGFRGWSLLDLQQDPTATETISVSLSFDPSPPFFDGYNGQGSSGATLPPRFVDDHPIRCVPTQLGPVHGTITVRTANCPDISISLSCNGVVPPPTPSPTPSPIACIGDCNGDGLVAINELITGVNIDFGRDLPEVCFALECEPGPLVYVHCLVLAVYNALYGCPPSAHPTATLMPSPTPTPTALIEPSVTVSPVVRTGFTLDGCVDEFPPEEGAACGQIGAPVRLDPLGLVWTTDVDYVGFHFTNVPPGDYVLSVIEGCNPWGCWPDVPVAITDHDVVVDIPLIPYIPAPEPKWCCPK